MIATLKERFPDVPIGYSGHETGLAPTWAAVSMGATHVERHITLDRAMWGTDQAASVEIVGLVRLVSNIRDIERSFGDGVKRVYGEEYAARRKLRRVQSEGDARPEAPAHAEGSNGMAREATNGVVHRSP
jgi:N-acetylneuraminate synthase